jgi:ribose transport system permease protein
MRDNTQKSGQILSRFLVLGKHLWNLSESGIIIITLLYGIFVQLMNPIFLSQVNLNSILRQTGYILIPAIGMTLVLIAGGLDLSVGSVLALAGIAMGFCALDFGLPIWLSIVLGLVAGLLIGLLNGLIIVRFSVPPMIITLGMMYVARGIVLVTTNGLAKYPLPKSFQMLEQGTILALPTVVPFCLILCVVFHIILTQTTLGRSIYAIGGNRETAKLAGIRVNRITLAVYSICGFMAALSGIVISSRLGSAQPSAGEGYEMNVIASCIIGGTSTFGGRGTILGTVIGALFMSILTNSMTLMKVNVNYQKLVIGIVLVFAVILDQYKRELAQKRAIKIGNPA